MTELTLRPFQLSKIKDDATIMIIGKRGVGKSTILRNIMYEKRHLPFGIACSGTEDGNNAFQKMLPPLFIYNDYDAKAIQRVIDRQRAMAKTAQGATPCFVVLDDCLYDKGVLKRPEMRQIFLNGRHWKFLLAACAQYCGDVPPAIRHNIDYLFVCRDTVIQSRRKIWENFFGLLEFKAFCALMDQVTEDYGVVVLDSTCKSNKPEDAIYWYKARAHLPSFRMGCKAYWEYGLSHFQKEEDPTKKRQASAKKLTVTIKQLPNTTKQKSSQSQKKKKK